MRTSHSRHHIPFWKVKQMFYPAYWACVSLWVLVIACTGLGMTADRLDGLERRWVSSAYFDRAMGYKNSRLQVISFTEVLDQFDPGGNADAVLLDCVDDYQAIVSVADIRQYDLQLAMKIELADGSDRPDWLNPLLIVVPNGKNAPFVERFLAANISELRFVKLANYYALLNHAVKKGSPASVGLKIFKDNCLFCHSIKGVGGNKGGSLPEAFDFSSQSEQQRFKDTFFLVHREDNANKQNTEQFLLPGHLDALVDFLVTAKGVVEIDGE